MMNICEQCPISSDSSCHQIPYQRCHPALALFSFHPLHSFRCQVYQFFSHRSADWAAGFSQLPADSRCLFSLISSRLFLQPSYLLTPLWFFLPLPAPSLLCLPLSLPRLFLFPLSQFFQLSPIFFQDAQDQQALNLARSISCPLQLNLLYTREQSVFEC